MGFFSRIFGKSARPGSSVSDSVLPKEKTSAAICGLMESDNVGTRCGTAGEGEAYFHSLFMKDPEPILFYFFESESQANAALAEVSCIKVAEDSGKFICTEILTYGVFPGMDEEGEYSQWAVLLAGKSLHHDLWTEARECFQRHGGTKRREDEPGADSANQSQGEGKEKGDPSLVQFSHERQDDSVFGIVATYRHHTAPNRASALAWLQQHPVNKPSYFLVVETPEGVVARDIQGIYEA